MTSAKKRYPLVRPSVRPVAILPAAALTLGALALASPLLKAQSAPSTSPLSAAKTIQYRGTFFVSTDGKLNPYFALNVQVERPGKVHIDALPVPQAGKPVGKASLYVSDGVTQHEYSGRSNRYINSKAPKPEESATSQLVNLAAVELILNPNSLPDTKQGIKRSMSKETVAGHEMLVTTDTQAERKGRDGSPITVFERVWKSAENGLPYRRALCVTQKGKTETFQQLDFTAWILDKPIPSAQFTWTPPAGSKEYIEPKLLSIGAAAPDFAVITPDGKTVHLSDFKGKPIVVDFWATWCGPCQQSMPHLESVYRRIKSKGVSVLGVCVWDEKAAYKSWLVEKKGVYSFPTVFDPAGRGEKSIAGSLYGVSGIPTQYIIDKDGKVAAVNVGYEDGNTDLEKGLAKIGIVVPTKADPAK